jgi:thioredoxin-like negative regulator of GroEL
LAQARRGGKPVLLVFGATWCEACHTLRKSLEHASLKEPLAGYVCVWLDTDKAGRIADRHEVQSLPHLEILDPNGKCLQRLVGHQTPEALRAVLVKHRQAAADRRQPNRRQPDRQGGLRDRARAGNMTAQQMQQELSRLRQQLQRLQRQQAEQQRTLQEILKRLRDR